jgi:hypothetical protein
VDGLEYSRSGSEAVFCSGREAWHTSYGLNAKRAADMCSSHGDGRGRLDYVVDLGDWMRPSESVRATTLPRWLKQFARLRNAFLELERRIDATSACHVNVRAKLMGRLRRLQVQCSRELRSMPFQPAHWKRVRAFAEGTVCDINRMPGYINRRTKMLPRQRSGATFATTRLATEQVHGRCAGG